MCLYHHASKMPLISRPSLYTHEMTHSARAALRTNVRSNMWSGFYYATTLYFPPPFLSSLRGSRRSWVWVHELEMFPASFYRVRRKIFSRDLLQSQKWKGPHFFPFSLHRYARLNLDFFSFSLLSLSGERLSIYYRDETREVFQSSERLIETKGELGAERDYFFGGLGEWTIFFSCPELTYSGWTHVGA